MKKLNGLILLSVFSFTGTYAQSNLDSLYTVWQDQTQPDSSRALACKDYIAKGYLFSSPDTAFILAEQLVAFANQRQYPKAKASAYNLQAISFHIRGNFVQALDYYQRSLKISEEIEDIIRIAGSLGNIGLINNDQGNYPQALNYYQRSLRIQEEIGHRPGIANSLNNIGGIYQKQGNSPQALDYYHRSLKIQQEIGDERGAGASLDNIGLIYYEQGNYTQALDYYQRSLNIREEIGNKYGIANSLNNIGSIYRAQSNYPQSLNYHQRSLNIAKEIGDKSGIATSLKSIGMIHQIQGEYLQALTNCEESLGLSKEIGSIVFQKEACLCLYKANKAMGNGIAALTFHEEMLLLEDSLNTQETAKYLQQMEFSKRVLQDSIATVEKERLVDEAHKEEVRQKNQTRNALIGGGIFLFLIIGGIYSRLHFSRKSKAVLQVEKDRSENLLLNILPADIAEELKQKGKADARDFDMVSILFTDFKGFTAASEKLSAQELVAEINTCFEAFDGIMGKYNIEKIKTIGDAYMAAGGLPVPTDDSVTNTILAALEMQAFITARKAKNDLAQKPAFEMRVGIHTGPVVAGIVGVKKFAYDIWGDTVNTASRMESSGEVGKVNISEATYNLVKDQFTCEYRGEIEAKGKGKVKMYFVELTA